MRYPIISPLVALALLSTGAAVGGAAGVAYAAGRTPEARVVGNDPACDALLSSYVSRGVDLVGPYGWDSFRYPVLAGAPSPNDSAKSSAPGAPSPEAATSSATGTNVQEAGVDEADVVKTNSRQLFRVKGSSVETWDVTGSSPRRLGTVSVSGVEQPEILLVGHKLIAYGDYYAPAAKIMPGWQPGDPQTRVFQYDVSDPAHPKLDQQWRYNAAISSARLYGTVVRFVLSRGKPALDFVQPDSDTGVNTATAKNQAIVKASTITDWLPSKSVFDPAGNLVSTTPAVGCAGVRLPQAGSDLGTTTIVGFDPTLPLGPAADAAQAANAAGVATTADTDYSSTDRLFLATSPGFYDCCIMFRSGDASPAAPSRTAGSDIGVTRLYSFALSGPTTAYAAEGGVRGYVRDRWSMDFANGVLRMGVGATEATGDASSVVTMTEQAGQLVRVGRLTGLGRHQNLKAMRWFDNLAFLVTFRQIDPLYAIDLSDPAHPKLLGKLKIPGYSDYLHPLGSKRLIGLGAAVKHNMNVGAQAALFNVSDLSRPRQLDVIHYPAASQAVAGWDPRQFLWLPGPRAAMTVIAKDYSTVGWVSVLRPRQGALHSSLIPIRSGGLVEDVRLVGLPGGKVVLSSTNKVRFLNWR